MAYLKDKGNIPLIVLVIGAVLLIGGFIYFSGKLKNENPTISDEIRSQTADWQSYKFKYGQAELRFPKGWLVKEAYSGPAEYKQVDFYPVKENSVIGSDYIITFSASSPYKSEIYDLSPVKEIAPLDSSSSGMISAEQPFYSNSANYNFSIPALGNKQNAHFDQQYNYTSIRFQKDGVEYSLSADINRALEQKMDPAEVTKVLTQMAKAITFFEAEGSCEEPVLKPLKDFPKSFVLVNNHESDRTDSVNGYFPNINPDPSELISLQAKSKNVPDRIFMAIYEADGKPIAEDSSVKSLAPISGGTDTFNKNKTVLMYVNCVNEIKDSGFTSSLYHIGDESHPFNIQIFGASDNPEKLWGVKEWNSKLLRTQRGTVYVQRGAIWQKYSLKQLHVTI